MKFKLSRLFAFLAVLFLVSQAGAQGTTLRGKITDTETMDGLPGANIEVIGPDGKRQGATTDLNGEFEILNLLPGTYSMAVSYIGYETHTNSGVRVTSGTQPLNIALVPTTIQLGERIVSSVSRQPEKVVSAPAAVSIIDASEIFTRPALTPAEHIKGLPGVDLATTGLNQTRIAIRGFNSPLTDSDKMLALTDYRNTRTPSLRYNISTLLSSINDDIDRIEVVSGPGSALYGPNAANGVMHIITKSPLDSEGTIISVGGGERDLFTAELRHAQKLSPRVGIKISGRYYQGTDWHATDPAEPDSVILGTNTRSGRVNQGGLIPNKRDENIENISVDARLDIRSSPHLTTVFSGGLARSSGLQITSVGASQNKDWLQTYFQGRVNYRGLFIQAFWNQGNLENSYMRRTGDIILDRSSLLGAQVQHRFKIADQRLQFTYGADGFFTRPNTQNTINGRNEDRDDINEIGLYLQTEATVNQQVKFIAAARLDDNNHLQDRVFSPRAAMVWSPDPTHSLRATYNRAFTTPPSSVLFLDINLSPTLGGLPFALRGLGTSLTGYSFKNDSSGGIGGLYMQSPFIPNARATHVPADAASMWGAVVGIFLAQGVDLSALPPPQFGQVMTSLGLLNTATGSFDSVTPSQLTDITTFEPSITNSFEVGYKGVFNSKLLATADLYYSKVEHFNVFDVQTPLVFFDPVSLAAYLGQFMSIEEASALTAGISAVPLGTVSFQESGQEYPADIIMTYRNFAGNVSLYGADVSLTYFANPFWQINGSYSYVSKNLFKKSTDQPQDIALNAPRHKLSAGVQYQNNVQGFNAGIRFRYVDKFPVQSGVYNGIVQAYGVLDLNASYTLPFSMNTRLTVSVQNFMNNMHQEFLGAPEIGRLGLIQLTQSF